MSQVIDVTFIAENDLSAKQYHFVEVSAENKVDVCDGVTDVAVGILQNDPTAGKAAHVRILGLSKLSANEALSVGDLVGASADGQGAPYVNGTDTTKYIRGIVVKAADNAAEIAEVLLVPFPRGA